MPQRNRTLHFDASNVQGEGAYVEFRAFTYGEQREAKRLRDEILALSGDHANELAQQTQQLLLDHLAAWNWVQDDGTSMPLLATLEDFDRLTMAEMMFLIESLGKVIQGTVSPN